MIDLDVVGVAAPKKIVWNGITLQRALSRKAIRQYGYIYDAASRTATIVFPYDHSRTDITIE